MSRGALSSLLSAMLVPTGSWAAAAPAPDPPGWTALFDGKTLTGWRTPSGTKPETSWTVEDGCLKAVPGPRTADLWTIERFRDFELAFEWRTPRNGNSGVKYLVQTWDSGLFRTGSAESSFERSLGFEYQLIDDASRAATDKDTHLSGALYNILPPGRRMARPPGEWNSSLLLLSGGHVEHWLNGVKVVEFRIGDPQFEAAVGRLQDAALRKLLSGAANRLSPIALQHHLTEMWFRNLKVRQPGKGVLQGE